MPARRRIDDAAGRSALAAWAVHDAGTTGLTGGVAPDRATTATAVRWSLEELAERAPGGAVEVRVAPYGVAQCLTGSRHTRGTPPNVVETDAATWLALVTGGLGWAEALSSGRARASGTRADLSGVLPLTGRPPLAGGPGPGG